MNRKTMLLAGLTACVTPVLASASTGSAPPLANELQQLQQSSWVASSLDLGPVQTLVPAELFRVQGGVKPLTLVAQNEPKTEKKVKKKPVKKKSSEEKKEG